MFKALAAPLFCLFVNIALGQLNLGLGHITNCKGISYVKHPNGNIFILVDGTLLSYGTNWSQSLKVSKGFKLVKLDSNYNLIDRIDLSFSSDLDNHFKSLEVLNDELILVENEKIEQSLICTLHKYDLELKKISEQHFLTVNENHRHSYNAQYFKKYNNALYSLFSVEHTSTFVDTVINEFEQVNKKKLIWTKYDGKSFEILGEHTVEFDIAKYWHPGPITNFAVDSKENLYFTTSTASTRDYNTITRLNKLGSIKNVLSLRKNDILNIEIDDENLVIIGVYNEKIEWGQRTYKVPNGLNYGFFVAKMGLKNGRKSSFKNIVQCNSNPRGFYSIPNTNIPKWVKFKTHEVVLTTLNHDRSTTFNDVFHNNKITRFDSSVAFLTFFCNEHLVNQLFFNGNSEVLLSDLELTSSKLVVVGRYHNFSDKLNFSIDNKWRFRHSTLGNGNKINEFGLIMEFSKEIPFIVSKIKCLGDTFSFNDPYGIYANLNWKVKGKLLKKNPLVHERDSFKDDYTVFYSIVKDNGITLQEKIPVNVPQKPMAKFNLEDSIICRNNSLVFTGDVFKVNSLDLDYFLIDSLQNQFKFNSQNDLKSFLDTGNYYISLVAKDADCVDTSLPKSIRVLPVPLKGFETDKTGNCIGDSFNFSDLNSEKRHEHKFVWNQSDTFDHFHSVSISKEGWNTLIKRVNNKHGCVVYDTLNFWVPQRIDSIYKNVFFKVKSHHQVIDLSWDSILLDYNPIFVEKRSNSGLLDSFAINGEISFRDYDVYINDSFYQYRVSFSDSCGTIHNIENAAQSLVLKLDSPISDSFTIKWNKVVSATNDSVEYRIQTFRNAYSFKDISNTADTFHQIGFGEYTRLSDSIGFRVVAESTYLRSVSNLIWVKDATHFKEPNLFIDSLQADINNLAKGSDYSLLLFNIEGRLLYSTSEFIPDQLQKIVSSSNYYIMVLRYQTPTGSYKLKSKKVLFLKGN